MLNNRSYRFGTNLMCAVVCITLLNGCDTTNQTSSASEGGSRLTISLLQYLWESKPRDI